MTTYRENQKTISEWANETFGPAGSNASVATRANEEMAELIRAIVGRPAAAGMDGSRAREDAMSWPPDFSADGLVTRGDARSWAVFSPDDRYRYLLGRTWGGYNDAFPGEPKRLAIWIMLNPSTADHTVDDPTIRKCIKYARRWGMDGVIVANLFAYRATDPRELDKVEDPIGPANDSILYRVTANPLRAIVVGGWGNKLPRRFRRRGEQLHIGRRLHCVAVNNDGSPRHPLYVRDDAPCVPIGDASPAPGLGALRRRVREQ